VLIHLRALTPLRLTQLPLQRSTASGKRAKEGKRRRVAVIRHGESALHAAGSVIGD